jgi:hypothetical protein
MKDLIYRAVRKVAAVFFLVVWHLPLKVHSETMFAHSEWIENYRKSETWSRDVFSLFTTKTEGLTKDENRAFDRLLMRAGTTRIFFPLIIKTPDGFGYTTTDLSGKDKLLGACAIKSNPLSKALEKLTEGEKGAFAKVRLLDFFGEVAYSENIDFSVHFPNVHTIILPFAGADLSKSKPPPHLENLVIYNSIIDYETLAVWLASKKIKLLAFQGCSVKRGNKIKLPSLEELILRDNRIKAIFFHSFLGCPQINKLSITGEPLDSVRRAFVPGMVNQLYINNELINLKK